MTDPEVSLPAWMLAIVDASYETAVLDAALAAITLADSLDQARGIAHAALHREQYLAGGEEPGNASSTEVG